MSALVYANYTTDELLDIAYDQSDNELIHELAQRLEAADGVLDSISEMLAKKPDDRQQGLELP